jgi:hypothetical protein
MASGVAASAKVKSVGRLVTNYCYALANNRQTVRIRRMVSSRGMASLTADGTNNAANRRN